jgi:hypothetical protein
MTFTQQLIWHRIIPVPTYSIDYRKMVSPLRWSSDKEEKHTVSGLPIALPVVGSQSLSSPSLLPLTSCLPSGDHAMHSTQFLCPVQPTHIVNISYSSQKIAQ